MISTLEKINQSTLKFLEQQTLEETFESIVEEAKRIVSAKQGLIFLEKDGILKTVYASPASLLSFVPRTKGYTAETYKTGRACVIKGESLEEVHPELKAYGFASTLFIPLSYGGDTIGVLAVNSSKQRLFSDADLEALKLFGAIASVAIRKTQFHTETLSIGGTLEKINLSAITFLEQLSLDKLFKTIVEEAKEIVQATHGSIYLADGADLKLVYATSSVFKKIKLRKTGFTYKAFHSKSPIIVDVENNNVNPQIRELGVKSTIWIPLAYRGRSVGVLALDSQKKDSFSQEELKVLKLFGAMASLAIKKNQLHSETADALRARDEFISHAAHELRTPLTSISGYAQLLQKRMIDSGTIESRWTQEMYTETNKLKHLINEILTVSRIKSDHLHFTWNECNLHELGSKIVTLFSNTYPNRKIDVVNNTSEKAYIIGDCDKLIQVAMSLLDNAAKFSPQDKTITLSIKQKKDTICISIQDNGIGISRTNKKHLFENYVFGSGTEKEGMGLGLYLASHLVKAHRGQVRILSKKGTGTTVEILLPKP